MRTENNNAISTRFDICWLFVQQLEGKFITIFYGLLCFALHNECHAVYWDELTEKKTGYSAIEDNSAF